MQAINTKKERERGKNYSKENQNYHSEVLKHLQNKKKKKLQ